MCMRVHIKAVLRSGEKPLHKRYKTCKKKYNEWTKKNTLNLVALKCGCFYA